MAQQSWGKARFSCCLVRLNSIRPSSKFHDDILIILSTSSEYEANPADSLDGTEMWCSGRPV
ncbi:hypothetical protein C8J55DRAFT_506786 [Lentinula edodes]|uniref:Uncharacterized protein n=1 Tax=Lentinula lateritia TaxID=40482 RepID=A0A9W9DW90_9AGAR|nr:hypothetical protein C8J55DRAFT_506786 [Lentinula edodes]